MHQMQVAPTGATLLREELVVELDQVVVLGVNDHHAALSRDLLHQVTNAPEIHFVRTTRWFRRQHVAGEHFETGKTRLNELRHLIKGAYRRSAHEVDMEAIVDERVSSPSLSALVECLLRRGTRIDLAEVDVRGHSTKCHAHRVFLGAQRVHLGFRSHADEVRQMSVRLYPARYNQQTSRVDGLRGVRRRRFRGGQRDDFSITHADVPVADCLGSDDETTPNQQIQHLHFDGDVALRVPRIPVARVRAGVDRQEYKVAVDAGSVPVDVTDEEEEKAAARNL